MTGNSVIPLLHPPLSEITWLVILFLKALKCFSGLTGSTMYLRSQTYAYASS